MKKMLLLPVGMLLHSFMSFSQNVSAPTLEKTEPNGVKIYSSEGFVSTTTIQSAEVESLDRPIRTMKDYSLEEIEDHLYSLEKKMEHVKLSQNQEAAADYLIIKSQLLERRKELTTNH